MAKSTSKFSTVHPDPPSSLLKIVILGDGNVGKSSLMTRYVRNEFENHAAHTVGVEFLRKEIYLPTTGEKYSAQIWDTAGQERFRCLQRPFYRGTDICLLVFAVDDKKSLENLSSWMREFQKYAEIDIARFPFIIIGNKIDVDDESRQVSEQEAKLFCQQLFQQNLISSSSNSGSTGTCFPSGYSSSYPYLETSAKNRVNINEAFQTAVSYMKELKSSTNFLSNSHQSQGGIIKLEAVNLRNVMKKGAKPCC